MTETRLRERPLPEFDAEQEVDFGRYGRAIALRWWVVVAGLVAGALIGLLLSIGGNTFYRAEAVIYLGQPLTPGGGGAIPGPGQNPRIVDQIVRAESTIREVASKTGLRPGQLRGHISTRSITAAVPRATTAPLYAISVTGRQPRKDARAADDFAQTVVNRVSGYPQVKIEQLKEHLAFDQSELDTVNARLETIQRQQQQVLNEKSLDLASRLVAINNFNSQLTFLDNRRANLEQDRFAVRQLLKLATDVEAGRIVTHASAVATTARSRRNSVLIGGLIGLILGALAAILWEPVSARFTSRPAQ
jgi:uncharacterized protein involved in exopolysaccharide biosynthesis